MQETIELLEILIEMTDEEYQSYKKRVEENKDSISEDMQKFNEALFTAAESFRYKSDVAAEQTPEVVEVDGIRVLTTSQLAEAYGTDAKVVRKNYERNRSRYVEGKHYICLNGSSLKEFKAKRQIDVSLNIHTLYLWTEKGALLHAKSLNTDKAWEVYDYLVDYYFRTRESVSNTSVSVSKPAESVPKVSINNPIDTFRVLINLADERGYKVTSKELKTKNSTIRGRSIGINTNLTVEQTCFELAYELSQALVKCDTGDVLARTVRKGYDSQAVRAAHMLLQVVER